ncbi:MAG: ferritin family protein [Chloroflexi bacterium]|nr:ferritin family protein [Chloroflexota bacterium]
MKTKEFEALGIIDAAKEVERKGEAFYRQAAQTLADPKAKKMLLSLAEDEVHHLEKLEAIRHALQKAFPALTPPADVGDMAARFKDRLFPEPPSEILTQDNKAAEITVLERGVKLEQDSIKLYEEAADQQTSPGAGSAFRRIAMEEKIHLFILNHRLDLLKL